MPVTPLEVTSSQDVFSEEFKNDAKIIFNVLSLNGADEKEICSENANFCSELTKSAWVSLERDHFHLRAELKILTPKNHSMSQLSYEIAAAKAHFSHMSNLLNKESLSDFVFVVRGNEFKVHKNILAAVSGVWDRMFSADYKEKETNSCEIDHIVPEIFKALLRYVYCAEIPENFDKLVVSLYEAAHYYEIEPLKKICLKKMSHDLSSTNAAEIYKIAHRYELDLLTRAWQIIKRYIIYLNKNDCLYVLTFNFLNSEILKIFLPDEAILPPPEKLDKILAMRLEEKLILMEKKKDSECKRT